MEYLVTATQMKDADRHTIQDLGIPSKVLMERAANACVSYIDDAGWDKEQMFIFCGAGNNGGDGFAIGRIYLDRGITSKVIFVGNEAKCTEETKYQMERYRRAGGEVLTKIPGDTPTIVIDAIFGVGLVRDITGSYAKIIEKMNEFQAKKLAVDISSGVSATTGMVLGCAFRADATVTFQEKKVGFAFYPAIEYAGEVVVADIGIDGAYVTSSERTAYTLDEKDIRKLLPNRREDSNKGSYGKLLVIAGSKGMSGAAYLASHAAYISGAGLVQIYTAKENRIPLQTQLPEAIVSTYDEYEEEALLSKLRWASAVCIGPGMGTSEVSENIVKKVLKNIKVPCLVDADALNILSMNKELLEIIKEKDMIFTPHMKEFSRLNGLSVSEIKEDKRNAAEAFADQYQIVLVAKDSRTLVSCNQENTYINTTGNASMAKGGSGDVLAGMISGFLVQGMTTKDAALLGVYLHGRSGDLAREELGAYSVLARNLIDYFPKGIRSLH